MLFWCFDDFQKMTNRWSKILYKYQFVAVTYSRMTHVDSWVCVIVDERAQCTYYCTYTVMYVCMMLPVVGGVEWYSVSLPGDVGLWYSVDLTLEASNASLVHSHGHWVGVELRKSWGANQQNSFLMRKLLDMDIISKHWRGTLPILHMIFTSLLPTVVNVFCGSRGVLLSLRK